MSAVLNSVCEDSGFWEYVFKDILKFNIWYLNVFLQINVVHYCTKHRLFKGSNSFYVCMHIFLNLSILRHKYWINYLSCLFWGDDSYSVRYRTMLFCVGHVFTWKTPVCRNVYPDNLNLVLQAHP